MPITTNVGSSNPIHGEVYSIQHYVIKFVSDLRQVGGFLWVLLVSTIKKTDQHDINEILLKQMFLKSYFQEVANSTVWNWSP
jgi:hypothetical protein